MKVYRAKFKKEYGYYWKYCNIHYFLGTYFFISSSMKVKDKEFYSNSLEFKGYFKSPQTIRSVDCHGFTTCNNVHIYCNYLRIKGQTLRHFEYPEKVKSFIYLIDKKEAYKMAYHL